MFESAADSCAKALLLLHINTHQCFFLAYCLVKLQTSFFHLHTVLVKKMACDVWDWSVSDDLSSARWKIFLSSLSVWSINFSHCDFPAFPSLCLDGWRLDFLQAMELLERPLEFPPLPWRCLAFHPEDVFSLSLMWIFMRKKELISQTAERNRHLVRFTRNSKSTSIKQEKCHTFVKHLCEQQLNDIFRLSGRLHTALCYNWDRAVTQILFTLSEKNVCIYIYISMYFFPRWHCESGSELQQLSVCKFAQCGINIIYVK